MQSDPMKDIVDRNGRKILGNSIITNLWNNNGSDTDTQNAIIMSKNQQEFKIPQLSAATSTPKNCFKKMTVIADSMQTYSSVDMGYSTMGSSDDPFNTPTSKNYSRDMTAHSIATTNSLNPIQTSWNKLRTDLLHCESGYVSDESYRPRFFPPYFHSTPNVTGSSHRYLLDSAGSVRSQSIFPQLVRDTSIGQLNLSEISGTVDSFHEMNHSPFMSPEINTTHDSRRERSQRMRCYFSFDESQGNIGSNICQESFDLLLNICKRHDKKIKSTFLKHLQDGDVSRLFLVNKELRKVLEFDDEAVARRQRFLEGARQRYSEKENSGRARIHSMLERRPGPRRPLQQIQVMTPIEKRKREQSVNKSSFEAIKVAEKCVHCSSCWKVAIVLGNIASCTNPECGSRHCTSCGRTAHSNRPCLKRQSYDSSSYSIGDKDSKSRLRRLARSFC